MGFATDAIHVGQEPDPSTGSIVAPIYQTSTYVQPELGKNKGYDYARTAHPNRRALERTVAKLEGVPQQLFSRPEWRRLIRYSGCYAQETTPFFPRPFTVELSV